MIAAKKADSIWKLTAKIIVKQTYHKALKFKGPLHPIYKKQKHIACFLVYAAMKFGFNISVS